MTTKKWSVTTLCLLLAALILLGGLTVVIDPLFHYHTPLEGLAYPINNERYQNDGIVKHFDYDAIITGTSMTENFKTSEFDEIFDAAAVKVAFSGASYREITENLERAFEANQNIRYVLRCLDYSYFFQDKDALNYDSYPTYLYDNDLLNDVSYIFNKDVLINNTLKVLGYTRAGGITTSFDKYANWMANYTFGKDAVAATYTRPDKEETILHLTEDERMAVEANLAQNITALAEVHPETTFYLFFSPYSIYYWDSLNQSGVLQRQLEAERAAIETLIECDNIKLFSFFDRFELITDLDNYKDIYHYSEDINSRMLQWMHDGEGELTPDNYEDYCRREWDFYTTYDYDDLFA